MKKIFLMLILVLMFSACAPQAAETAEEAPAPSVVEQAPPAEEPTAPPVEVSTDVPAEDPTDVPTEAAVEAPTEPPAADSSISFMNDVAPIIESRCSSCHNDSRSDGGLDMSSYASLLEGSNSGAVVVPGDAANSVFVQVVEQGRMPRGGSKLTPDQVQIFLDWVDQGAADN